MKAAINDVAAIQPAVGGGAAVAAPAVGGLAPAIGAGGGGGCHPGNSGDGAAPAAPAAAPAIGAGAGGDSSGDGAAAAAEEPFPEAEIAAAMIADGFKRNPSPGYLESAVPPPAPAPSPMVLPSAITMAPVGGAAVAAPAVGGLAPAIGAGGGGGCTGDGAAAAAEEPFPEAESAAPIIADGFEQYHMPGGVIILAPIGGDGDDERGSNWSEVVASASLPAVDVGNNTVPGASSCLPAVGNNTVPGASSSLPVVGGNQKLHGIMSDWDVNGMVRLLESISLGHLSKAFIENGLDGAFSSSARRRSWPRLVLPHCSSRKSWPTRRAGRKINEPAVGGSLPCPQAFAVAMHPLAYSH